MSNEPKVDLAGVDELVGRLRDDWPEILVEKHWMMDSDAIDEQREEAATALQSLAAQLAEARAENERLREALESIAQADYGYMDLIESGSPQEKHTDYFCSRVTWRQRIARAALKESQQ